MTICDAKGRECRFRTTATRASLADAETEAPTAWQAARRDKAAEERPDEDRALRRSSSPWSLAAAAAGTSSGGAWCGASPLLRASLTLTAKQGQSWRNSARQRGGRLARAFQASACVALAAVTPSRRTSQIHGDGCPGGSRNGRCWVKPGAEKDQEGAVPRGDGAEGVVEEGPLWGKKGPSWASRRRLLARSGGARG